MTATREPVLGAQTPSGSARVRLAELSRATALRTPGVAAMDSGPTGLFVTVGEKQRIDGVRCVAAGDGGYEVSLRLRCELVPLRRVGEAVRSSISGAAVAAGIAVAEVNVLIADVVEPGGA